MQLLQEVFLQPSDSSIFFQVYIKVEDEAAAAHNQTSGKRLQKGQQSEERGSNNKQRYVASAQISTDFLVSQSPLLP